jgi:hypothetical protein
MVLCLLNSLFFNNSNNIELLILLINKHPFISAKITKNKIRLRLRSLKFPQSNSSTVTSTC